MKENEETDLSVMSEASYNMLMSSLNSFEQGKLGVPVDVDSALALFEIDYQHNIEYAFDAIENMKHDELVDRLCVFVGKLNDEELDSFVEALKKDNS